MSAERLGPEPAIHPHARVSESRLGRYTEVGARTSMIETEFGDYSYVVNDSDVIYTRVGKFCSIASHVRINPGNHPISRASQAHFTYRASAYWPEEPDEDAFFEWRRQQPVTLGNDIWIGHGAVILPGRTIGTGAVIGAGSIVTRDVAPYTIVAGSPARVLRRRFEERIAERVMRLAWWDWDHERLRQALPEFRMANIDAFLESHGG